MDDYEKAWGEYHEDFIKRKNKIISYLESIKVGMGIYYRPYDKWLDEAIEFIKEQKG